MTYVFDAEHEAQAAQEIAKYPAGRQASAVIALLDLAQRQHPQNVISPEAIEYVAARLEMAMIRVYEVASFYSMLNLAPVGTYHIQLCGTTPCMLCGAEQVRRAIEQALGLVSDGRHSAQTTHDGTFTLTEVECLGACANAPMMQINDDYYEDLDPSRAVAIIEQLKRGETPTVGSQTGRQGSAPANTTQLPGQPPT